MALKGSTFFGYMSTQFKKKLSVLLIYRFIYYTTIGHEYFYEGNHSLKRNSPFLKIDASTISITLKKLKRKNKNHRLLTIQL